MAWFLFIDESGQDHKASPYEVLAGAAVRDGDLGPLIQCMHEAEIFRFGRRYSAAANELKGKKLLKTKVFQHARLNISVCGDEISLLARRALDDGANAGIRELKGLALAKTAYVTDVLTLCSRFGVKVFASVVETDAQPTTLSGLRKDYAYLFERFFYFLEDRNAREQGIIVFDELEKAKSHVLIEQSLKYFRDTAIGKQRASLIVPEPFFVHSELTTGVQVADLVAYNMSWAFRTSRMKKPRREELDSYAQQIASLRYCTTRTRRGNANFEIWSVAHITDLRTNIERLADDSMDGT